MSKPDPAHVLPVMVATATELITVAHEAERRRIVDEITEANLKREPEAEPNMKLIPLVLLAVVLTVIGIFIPRHQ